jgi:hypothetical protein
MGCERGQASVEWVGIVLLVAIALAGMTQFAPSADGRSIASTLLHAVAKPQVAEMRSGKRNDSLPPGRGGFTAPPPLPFAGGRKAPAGGGGPSPRTLLGRLRSSADRLRASAARLRSSAGRLRSAAGTAWRRAWMACLAYERFRYAFLHPESRFPGHTIPSSELLRIANDCVSPADLVRDWPHYRGR